MDLGGEHRIPATRAVVWEALNDPEVLRVCIEGCEAMQRLSPTEFTARVKARIGPVQAVFAGAVTLTDVEAPGAYTLVGQGQGGVAGFVRGRARVTLTAEGDATVLRYEARADVGGKLASVGNRLIQGVVAATAATFFDRLAARLAMNGLGRME
ncbi:MAG: carbon monoxide dehydrogenase subunit G [Alphaproteobacteria bacterium]